MGSFDDREQVFEKKYAQDEKHSFNIEARASKLFGLWAAQQLGIDDENSAMTYAMTVVESNLEEPGMDDVLRKVQNDFSNKGLTIDEDTLKSALSEAVEEARVQLSSNL